MSHDEDDLGQRAINDLNKSLDSVQTTMDTLRASAAIPDVTEYAVNDARLTGSSLNPSLRQTLPSMSRALAECRTKTETLAQLAEHTSSVLGVLGSHEYAQAVFDNCARVFVGSPEFVQAVERVIEQRESSGSTSRKRSNASRSESPNKEPKVSDPVLIELVHFFFHECTNKSYTNRITGHVVKSDLASWPGPTASGTAVVSTTTGGVTVQTTVFRPDWSNADAANSAPFLAEVESRLLSANGNVYAEKKLEVRSAIRTYWETARKAFNRQPGGSNAQAGALQEVRRVRHNRNVTSHSSLAGAFERSVLARCREGNILEEALANNKTLMSFFVATEPDHGLRSAEQAGFNEWAIYQDLSRGTVAETGVWLAVDQGWWSLDFRRAYWALYETVRQSSVAGSYTKSPVFHLPRQKWSNASALPTVRPKRRDGGSEPASNDSTWVCSWMVDQSVLEAEENSAFVQSLHNEPETDAALPSLEELLRTDATLAGIRDAVERHLQVLPELDDRELQRLWGFRAGIDLSVYKSVLQAHVQSL